ncbi:MAG: hypothetical protein A2504_17850 [Bdellovibrionales bacterium RIFOXYD12_FULL_39_22]|nr:MAG: hypothetical protein A2385_15190 [Bdellovibrionales bacterium RIFOXYB1_FULL_39_21]OFZ48566.1 MAG: hypothetical protein A2404_17495 [Bdellovibrionales bacterium RIFOXYC1_FULL_39_130]OFZ76667.1 MAG: hypothetical protein A2560_04860 [Bdellovibrionales bacterium RIFOXYD1_FULL_39_84]OFZ95884.1 MAG: hypothetical protein A2504_17850 [Bdellovibrionales bacterium RIFOXYD12_FULL_39_22]
MGRFLLELFKMKHYLKLLSFLYLIGAILHLLDLLDLRLIFSEMGMIWKVWIVFLLVGDTFVSVSLWRQKLYGEIAFLTIGFSQLIAYTVFRSYFGNQTELIIFHMVTISVYALLKFEWGKRILRSLKWNHF